MKLLALQLKRIGDLILTTPALFALRQHFPNAHITLAVEHGCRELLPAIDFVDETLVFHRGGLNGPLWRKLIFRSFDVCLDFTGNDRSAFFALISKAPKRAGFEWLNRSPMRAMFYTNFVDSSVRANHTVDHYLHLLRAVGIDPVPDVPVTLHLPDWAHKKASQLLAECGVEGDFVLVHPGTARPEKYWLPERWSEVMEWCERELRVPCVISGSNDGAEQKHLRAIKSALQTPARDLSGRLDLLTLAALTGAARLVLTVDSAPMHLASAFGTPQVALFGKTNPFHWRARHPGALTILASQPDPNPDFTPHHEAAPMTDISTEMVVRAIRSAPLHVEQA